METEPRPLEPLTKTRLHEQIMEALKDRIVRGDLPVGAKLPSERELAQCFGVTRTTVREALHKLESMGLVDIKHGTGIVVKDFLDSGSLELARLMLSVDGRLDGSALGDLMELRRLLLPEIGARAAANRSAEELRELERLVFHADDMPLGERDWRLHNAIARASGNLLFVVVLNAFTSFARDASKLYFDVPANQQRSLEFHREIYAAIEASDVARARQVMAEVMEFADVQTEALLERRQ